MKKTLIALSIVCASALALADSAQYNADWFKGIGDRATATNDMQAVNGSWQFPATEGCATVNGSRELVLALDVDDEDKAEEATFTIDAEGETGTEQTLSVTGVFNPVSAEDLLSGTEMSNKNAQVGFAVVGVKAGGGAMTYKYYAWVGAMGGATAAADWVELSNLGTVADPAAPTALTIELNYWDANAMTAAFKVGDKAVTNTLTSTAAQNKKIASVSCTGSGTLSALNGAYQEAVAQANGKKYPTVEAAVASGASEVTLLKAADGTVTVSGSVIIDSNGKGAPTVTVDAEKDNSKEAVTDEETHIVTVQTKTTILAGVKVGTAEKDLMAKEADFRKFLNTYCTTAYTKANTTPGDIKLALETENETSHRTLWQSYALGVEPAAVVTPQQVAQDMDKDNITLSLPIKPTGDFTVKCVVGDKTSQTLTAENTSIAVPMKTGHYAVKITLE